VIFLTHIAQRTFCHGKDVNLSRVKKANGINNEPKVQDAETEKDIAPVGCGVVA